MISFFHSSFRKTRNLTKPCPIPPTGDPAETLPPPTTAPEATTATEATTTATKAATTTEITETITMMIEDIIITTTIEEMIIGMTEDLMTEIIITKIKNPEQLMIVGLV